MIDASGILSIIDKKSAPVKNILFGTISSDLKVIFDGETQPSQKQIACISYTPVAGDRVAIYKQGQICLILGNIGQGGGGDLSESHRIAVITALQGVVGTNPLYGGIASDATWDTIISTISMIYASGLKIQVQDIVNLTVLGTSDSSLAYFLDTSSDTTLMESLTLNQLSPSDSIIITLV
jgi:hypothetical protein